MSKDNIDSFEKLVDEIKGVFDDDIWQNTWRTSSRRSSLPAICTGDLAPSDNQVPYPTEVFPSDNFLEDETTAKSQPTRVVWSSFSSNKSSEYIATPIKKEPQSSVEDSITDTQGSSNERTDLRKNSIASLNSLDLADLESESSLKSETEDIAIVYEAVKLKEEESQELATIDELPANETQSSKEVQEVKEEESQELAIIDVPAIETQSSKEVQVKEEDSQELAIIDELPANETQTSSDLVAQSEVKLLPISLELADQSFMKFCIPPQPQPVKISIECYRLSEFASKINAFAQSAGDSVQMPLHLSITHSPPAPLMDTSETQLISFDGQQFGLEAFEETLEDEQKMIEGKEQTQNSSSEIVEVEKQVSCIKTTTQGTLTGEDIEDELTSNEIEEIELMSSAADKSRKDDVYQMSMRELQEKLGGEFVLDLRKPMISFVHSNAKDRLGRKSNQNESDG